MEKKKLLNPKNWNKRYAWTIGGTTLVLGGLVTAMVVPLMLNGDSANVYTNDSEIAFVPNNNNLYDGSFNADSHKGVQEYSRIFDTNVEIFLPQGATPTNSDLVNTFANATRDNDGVITNGFTTEAPMEEFLNTPGNEDKYAIMLDSAFLAGQDNVVAIDYRGEEAGFAAGVSAALWSDYKTSTGSDPLDANVSIWGGMANPGVTPILSGFEQGVNWYNYRFTGNTDSVMYNPLSGEQHTATTTAAARAEAGAWYSGDFAPGEDSDAASLNASQNSSVVFPVAGGQVSDAMYYAGDMKVIGADSDLTQSYPEDSDKIIGSATKNLALSAQIGMWWAERWVGLFEEDLNNLYQYGNAADRGFYFMLSETGSSSWFNDGTTIGDNTGLGQHFTGTYANGGVGYVKSESGLLDEAIDFLDLTQEDGITQITTFEELLSYGFSENPVIEAFSPTFVSDEVLSNPDLGPIMGRSLTASELVGDMNMWVAYASEL